MLTGIIIVLSVILAMAGLYYLLSLRIIKETERGVLIVNGKIKKMIEPGRNFCPWLISRVKIYKTTPMVFKITVPTVITKNGKVRGYKEDGKEIEKAEVNISLILTTYFSEDEHRLLETAKRAPGNDATSLGPFVDTHIIDITRAIFAEMPWVLSNQNRQKVLDYMTSKVIPLYPYTKLEFTTADNINTFYFDDLAAKSIGDDEVTMERYNPLVQFKLDMSRTSLRIIDINFCSKTLADSITLAETARQTAEANQITSHQNVQKMKDEGQATADNNKKDGLAKAEVKRKEGLDAVDISKLQGAADAEIIESKGLALAKAREEMIKVIKDNKDLEALNALIEMAKGTSNTILYGLPSGLSDKMSGILGGNKPEDILGFLKDPAIISVLKDAFEKITK